MTINTQRRGEIAIMYLKSKLLREGVIKPNVHRETANEAEELGISAGEAAEFAEMLIREIVEEEFAKMGKK